MGLVGMVGFGLRWDGMEWNVLSITVWIFLPFRDVRWDGNAGSLYIWVGGV